MGTQGVNICNMFTQHLPVVANGRGLFWGGGSSWTRMQNGQVACSRRLTSSSAQSTSNIIGPQLRVGKFSGWEK